MSVRDAGAGCHPQVSEVWYNGADGDGRQRQHGAQYRYQVWNPQNWRRLSGTRRKRVQPADTRDSRRTGEITSLGRFVGDVTKCAVC